MKALDYGLKKHSTTDVKSQFEILNEKIDREEYGYLINALQWDVEERIDRFPQLVLKISDLLITTNKYVDLVKHEEVTISTFEKLGDWCSITDRGNGQRRGIAFSIEGIEKSTEFCFQMIFRELMILMQYRVLKSLGNVSAGFRFRGKNFRWSHREIIKRLGLVNYKIFEDLTEFEKSLMTEKELMEECGEIEGNNNVNGVNKGERIGNSLEGVKFDYSIREKHATTDTVSYKHFQVLLL